MRSNPLCLLALACLLLTGCAQRPPASDARYQVSGEVYQAESRVRVLINGEQAIDGYLPMTESPDAAMKGAVFPLRGEYRGEPVEVGCGLQPVIAFPYCEVSVSGELVEVLIFDRLSGKAGCLGRH